MNLDLPEPDGQHFCGAEAWWRMSSGDLLFANPGEVFTSSYDPRCLDGIEQDALASLAAVQWARAASQTHAGDRPA